MAILTDYSRSIASIVYPLQPDDILQSLHTEEGSRYLPEDLRADIYPKSQNRYRFVTEPQDAAANAVFEAAFKKAPEEVIDAAETNTGTSSYPLWKRVALIYLPDMIGTVMGDALFQGAVVFATIIFGYELEACIYEIVQTFIVTQMIPFIINNAPVAVIGLFNTAMEYLTWEYLLCALLCAWIIQELILLGPEIPYVTDLAKNNNIGKLLWDVLWSFLIIDVLIFMGRSIVSECTDISQFFLQVAERARNERILLSKTMAHNLWMRDIFTPDGN